MTKPNPFRYFNTSPAIIRLAAMIYVQFLLSLRNVEPSMLTAAMLRNWCPRSRTRRGVWVAV
jgi:hypothetical protein